MKTETKKIGIQLSTASLYILIVILFIYIPYTNAFSSMISLFALLGYVSMSIAALMTPFAAELYKIFGKSFIKIHHIFAISGLILITLHPVTLAIYTGNPLVFLPRFDSWIVFWELAGRPALILVYVGAAAGGLRNIYKNSWKKFHNLLYVALFFGLIHGTLIGSSFKNIFVTVIFYLLFLSVMLAFFYKRHKNHKRRKHR